jgi:hypothetical protein
MTPFSRRAAVVWLGVATLLGACKPPRVCTRPIRQTIIFYDQSASSVVDTPTAALFSDSLVGIVDSALSCPGDGVHGFLVHGSTTAKAGRVDESQTFVADTLKGPHLKRAQEKIKFKAELTGLRQRAVGELRKMITGTVRPDLKRHTDLLGTFQVISDELSKVDTSQSARIYYFSDMRESMVSPRRDFDVHPPADKSEAERWADEDEAVLRNLTLHRSRFRTAEIRVLMGNLADKPRADAVRAYWERIFRNVGFPPDKIIFN